MSDKGGKESREGEGKMGKKGVSKNSRDDTLNYQMVCRNIEPDPL